MDDINPFCMASDVPILDTCTRSQSLGRSLLLNFIALTKPPLMKQLQLRIIRFQHQLMFWLSFFCQAYVVRYLYSRLGMRLECGSATIFVCGMSLDDVSRTLKVSIQINTTHNIV